MTLGIIDWGIGGISIYKLIKERLGDVSVVYLSDTGATPYGKMKQSELIARLNSVLAFLRSRGVTHLVIGCNAASTVIPLLDDHGVKIEGMIDNAVAMVANLRPTRLGVIGGRRTVLSGVYRVGFAANGINVEQRIAQPLSGLIEGGDVNSERLRAEARRILNPIRNSSHILLACTHYPAITEVLGQVVSPTTELIDPAASIVSKVGEWRLERGGPDIFLTSGNAASMTRSARLAFGVHIPKVSKIDL